MVRDIALALCFLASSLQAATYPAGFTETLVATGLSSPTAMAFAPDGRLFVCQQGGSLRVIKDGSLLAAPFLTVNVSSVGERGLLGVTFDPNFATNQFVYVYYTATTPAIHNRVSRFTASGDVAVAGSEVIILELENLSTATNHNGGAIHFGPDGKLYVAVGENANAPNAQLLTNRLGKMLRINSDGSIPADNPLLGSTSGPNQSIWAYGLRNPFTFAFQPGTGRMFINDVGQNTWEEINDGLPGANYGWPTVEGVASNPSFVNPIFAYPHGSGNTSGCAITGGAFYNPVTQVYPAEYAGVYFFADFCNGWIRKLDPANNNAVTGFATAVPSAVDLQTSVDGFLYYLTRTGGSVYRIGYSQAVQAPQITTHPQSQTIPSGQPVTFSVTASGTPPLSYQWHRNSAPITGATNTSYTIGAVSAGDNGAQFHCVVSNSAGSATSNTATLTVTTQNTPPVATIVTPAAGTLYTAGTVLSYSGSGTDAQDGTLPASAFTWKIDFHHDAHIHPFLPETSGAAAGSITLPNTGETSSDVWYRVTLTVRDLGGLTHTVFRDVQPRKVTIKLATSPAGLQVTLDGQPQTATYTFVGVAGMIRGIGAAATATVKNRDYVFESWSDGGAITHNIVTPSVNTTYTARYTRVR